MSESSHSKDELNETAIAYDVQEAALELPVSNFDSRPPALTPSEYVAWCDRTRRDFKVQDNAAKRLALKVSKEFVW
jgi:hypothetical protein